MWRGLKHFAGINISRLSSASHQIIQALVWYRQFYSNAQKNRTPWLAAEDILMLVGDTYHAGNHEAQDRICTARSGFCERLMSVLPFDLTFFDGEQSMASAVGQEFCPHRCISSRVIDSTGSIVF